MTHAAAWLVARYGARCLERHWPCMRPLPVLHLMIGRSPSSGLDRAGTHTHTVVLLHPEGTSAEDAYGRLYRRFGSLAQNCKFVFPRAPSRKVAANAAQTGKTPTEAPTTHSCWYVPRPPDRKTEQPEGEVGGTSRTEAHDTAAGVQLAAQTRRIHAILDREGAMLGGDMARLVLGGTSQGGTVAAHAAMGFRLPLGGLICLRTMVSERFTVVPTDSPLARMPVFVFAAGRDTVCPLPQQKASFSRLSSAGFNVDWHVEPDLTHSVRAVPPCDHRAGMPRHCTKSVLGSRRGASLIPSCG